MENKTVDKGWAAMQNMLDREMPVKKRRRAAWWWFSLLLLPVTLLAGWWYESATPVVSPVSTPEHPASPAIAQTQPAVAEAEINGPGTQPSYEHNTPATTAKYTQKRTSNLKKPLDSNLEPGLAPTQEQIVAAQESEQNRKAIGLDLVPNAPAQPLEIPNTVAQAPSLQTNNLPVIKPASTFKPFWSIGATSMASTEKFQTVNGFSTGVTVDWTFARKWGLRTGFFYNIHTPQEESRPIAAIQSKDYTLEGEIWALDLSTGQEILQMPGMRNVSDMLEENVYVPVSRLQRLELPVSLYWQPTKALKILGGLSVAKTLVTKADRFNYSGVYQINLNDQAAEKGVSELSAQGINTWNVQANLGMGWRVSQVFELGINGTLPFQRMKRLEGITDNQNSIPDYTNIRVRTQRTPLLALYGTIYF